MKPASAKKSTSSKAPVKVKPLSPRKDPKGGMFFPVLANGLAKGVRQGGGGGCDDEFGCSGNHGQVIVTGARS